MMIHRIIPNLKVRDSGAGHDFYVDFLGLEKQFDLGWIASFRSPENRSIQVSLVSGDASAPEDSAISVAVDDVDDDSNPRGDHPRPRDEPDRQGHGNPRPEGVSEAAGGRYVPVRPGGRVADDGAGSSSRQPTAAD